MRRVLLIAEREVRAYCQTPTFWVALALAPLLLLLATAFLARAPSVPPPRPIMVIAPAEVRPVVATALTEAGKLVGRDVAITSAGAQADIAVRVTPTPSGGYTIDVEKGVLWPAATALVQRDLRGWMLEDRLRTLDRAARAPEILLRQSAAPSDKAQADVARLSRFAMTMLLWLNLVGAMGMLLQAVVRERANRSLESLLAAARPGEVVVGKLLGVGAVSLTVVLTWMASGAAMALGPWAPGSDLAAPLLQAFGRPETLALALVVYAAAFAMYGSAILAVGALAADLPAAQNLSRPLFVLLLVVFFLILKEASLGSSAGWLLWAPPLTPFRLMMAEPGALSAATVAAALAVMAATAAGCGWLAAQLMAGRRVWPRRLSPSAPGRTS